MKDVTGCVAVTFFDESVDFSRFVLVFTFIASDTF